MDEPLQVGLIGAGANSRLRHIPGFQAIDGVEVVAVANRSRASAESVAREFGIPLASDDWRELIEDPQIGAICIGTWPVLHREATVAALRAGKHVLCEARMARDLAEARDMAACAAEFPHLVAQLVPSPFTLGVDEWIAGLVEGRIFGELLEIRARFLNGTLRDPQAPLTWRLDPTLSGKNTMVLGILHEAILRWIPDRQWEVKASAGWGSTRRPDADGRLRETVLPESLQIAARSPSGLRLLYDLGQLHAGEPIQTIELNGTQGGLCLDLARGDATLFLDDAPSEHHKIADAWDVEGEFVRSIRRGTPVTRTSFPDGLHYMTFTEEVWNAWNQPSNL